MRFYLVALGCIVSLFSCSDKQAKNTTSKSITFISNDALDSTQLKRYVNAVKLKYADWHGDSLDSINWDVVDSLLSDGRTTCCDGNIFYSPDSSFKIYVIKGESCGGYCN